jgi:uncharacterized membrane protein
MSDPHRPAGSGPTKVCPHCRMEVPIEASICAYCRRAIGGAEAAVQGIAGLVSIALIGWLLWNWYQSNQAVNQLFDSIKK